MTLESQNQEHRMRSIPGTFSPAELRDIRRKTYQLFREGGVDYKKAREMTRGLMSGYILDPSRVPEEMRPLVASLPSLGARR